MQALNAFHILIALGSLQGFFLAVTFFRLERYNRVSNKFLALSLVSTSMLNLMNISGDICLYCKYPIMDYLPLNWSIVIPFSLYYFVMYLIHPDYQITKRGYLLLLAPVVLDFTAGFIRLGLYLFAPAYSELYDGVLVSLGQVFEIIAMIQLFVVIIIIFRELRFFQLSLYNHFSNLEQKSLVWLRNSFIGIFILGVLWVAAELNGVYHLGPNMYWMYPLAIGMSVIIYWVAYSMHLRTDLFEVPTTDLVKEFVTTTVSLSAKADDHIERVIRLMEEEHLYRDPDLSMTALADRTGLSRGYLSQIINQKEGKNFFDFVNGYRIAEVQRHFADPKYDHFTILGIGQESGFKSKSTFNAVFKKIMKQTPSQYKRGLGQSS